MWSYYGNKTNVVDCYPKPKFGSIIEPFAGSAQYALKYFENEVILVDKYDVIIKIWHFLQQASPQDILKLPKFKQGDFIDDFQFDCEDAKLLMGFLMGFSSQTPRKTGTSKLTTRPNFINFNLQKIDGNLYKIKHWDIRHGSYEDIPNQQATWFIDPPYEFGGQYYKHSNKNIDFVKLGTWAMDREGQVIVCEVESATWMDFKPLRSHMTKNGMQKEVVWSNLPMAYDNVQQNLFK